MSNHCMLDENHRSRLAVPSWAVGAWQRRLLEWDDGEDRDTDVLWLQSPILFADIRNPSDPLKTAEGFAGHLSVAGQTCRWNRPIDVKPKGGDGDVGVVSTRRARMIEIGVHRNYLEEWQRIDDGVAHFAASRGAVRIDSDGVHWPISGPLEIVIAIGSNLTHAWRGTDGSGAAHGRVDTTGKWRPERAAGTVERASIQGQWTVWSNTLEPNLLERILTHIQIVHP